MSVFSVKAKNSSGAGEVPPAGTHPAVCVGVIDLGTQPYEYQGQHKMVRMVYLLWEMTAEKVSGFKDRNHVIGRSYNVSFGPKSTLRQLVEKWRGKSFAEGEEFDLAKLAGQKCLLIVTHNDKGYARVDGVSSVPKGMDVPAAQHRPVLYEVGGAEPIPEDDWIPWMFGKTIADHVRGCEELKAASDKGGATGAKSEFGPPSDEAPF